MVSYAEVGSTILRGGVPSNPPEPTSKGRSQAVLATKAWVRVGFKFTAASAGKIRHPLGELGQYHCNNRAYDINSGRWISPDQASSPWWDLFDYVGQRSVQFADPTGLEQSWQAQLDYEKDLMSKEKLTELFRAKCGTSDSCCTYDCCMRGARRLAEHLVGAIKVARDKLEDQSYGWAGNAKNTYRKMAGKKPQCNECADWREVVEAAVGSFKVEEDCECAKPEYRRGHEQTTFWAFDWTTWQMREYLGPQHNWAIVKFCGAEVNVDPWANGWADGSVTGTDINDSSAEIHKKDRETYEKTGGYRVNKWGDLERGGRRGF